MSGSQVLERTDTTAKIHILTKTSKEPEIAHHTGTLPLSLQIWKHRYMIYRIKSSFPRWWAWTTYHLWPNIFYDEFTISDPWWVTSPAFAFIKNRLRSTHSSCVRIYSIHVPGWLLKWLNFITAPGSVSNEPGSVTWLATKYLKKSMLSVG